MGFSVSGNAMSMRKRLQIWEHFRFLIFQASDTQPVYCNNSYCTNTIFIVALTLTMMVADVHGAGILLYALYMKIPCQVYESGAPRILLTDEVEEVKCCARGSFGIKVFWLKVPSPVGLVFRHCSLERAVVRSCWSQDRVLKARQPDVPNLYCCARMSSTIFMLETMQTNDRNQSPLSLTTLEGNLWFRMEHIHRYH